MKKEDTYPEYKFLPWKFKNAPRNIWEDENVVREYLYWVAKELNIQDLDDWYKVTNQQLVGFRLRSIDLTDAR